MNIRATKIFQFHMAHKLDTAYTKECLNLHGHTYKLEVTVQASRLNADGMVCDFKLLKETIRPIIEMFDHTCLTKEECGYNPTAENMAVHIFGMIAEALVKSKWTQDTMLSLYKVKLWETDTAFVTIEI